MSLERSDEDLIARVVLLADEVVTNAVLHGEGPIDLAVEPSEERVKVTVRDRSDARPVAGEPACHAEEGRGLSIVEALASRWGVSSMEPGKSVWFEIDRAS
jgi:serine/threonine-protein kinase RsbW